MPKEPTSPVDRLGRDAAGFPEYGWHGQHGAKLAHDFPQLTRHGQGGTPHLDVDGRVNYDKPAKGHTPKAITDPTGKAVKLGDDRHGLLMALQTAAQRARVPVPAHVMALLAQHGGAEADRRLGDLRSHLERGTGGDAQRRAFQDFFHAPFATIAAVGSQHLDGPKLRALLVALAHEFRDGASRTLPDGQESPIPLPLASWARHFLTADERRDGTEVRDILPAVDRTFHDGLGRARRLADKAATAPHDGDLLRQAGEARAALAALGAHHTAALAAARKRTRDDDAKEPRAARKEKVRALADSFDGERDATLSPATDEELAKFRTAVQALVRDPDSFVEVNALPNKSQAGGHHDAGRTYVVRALEEAAARESAAPPEARTPLEVLIAHTLIAGLAPRARGQVDRAMKTGDPKYWHALAHAALHADRHALARAIVTGHHDQPDRSLCAQVGVDPYRVARRIVGSLPGPDDLLRHLTESGAVTPPKGDEKKPQAPGKGQSMPTLPAVVLPMQKAAVLPPPLALPHDGGAIPYFFAKAAGRPRGTGRPPFPADSGPDPLADIPPDAIDPRQLAQGGAAQAMGRLTAADRARDDFHRTRDAFHTLARQSDGMAPGGHIGPLTQHGIDALNGPLSGIRDRLNAIGGPALTQRFLTHYAATHPGETRDPALAHRHWEDHVGHAAAAAMADHLRDANVGRARRTATLNYAANRQRANTNETDNPAVREIRREYYGTGGHSGARGTFLRHTMQARVNDAIRDQYTKAPDRQHLPAWMNAVRGHADVLARGSFAPIFGHIAGHAMDRLQQHFDLRRAQRTAEASAREQQAAIAQAARQQVAQAGRPAGPGKPRTTVRSPRPLVGMAPARPAPPPPVEETLPPAPPPVDETPPPPAPPPVVDPVATTAAAAPPKAKRQRRAATAAPAETNAGATAAPPVAATADPAPARPRRTVSGPLYGTAPAVAPPPVSAPPPPTAIMPDGLGIDSSKINNAGDYWRARKQRDTNIAAGVRLTNPPAAVTPAAPSVNDEPPTATPGDEGKYAAKVASSVRIPRPMRVGTPVATPSPEAPVTPAVAEPKPRKLAPLKTAELQQAGKSFAPHGVRTIPVRLRRPKED